MRVQGVGEINQGSMGFRGGLDLVDVWNALEALSSNLLDFRRRACRQSNVQEPNCGSIQLLLILVLRV